MCNIALVTVAFIQRGAQHVSFLGIKRERAQFPGSSHLLFA